MKTDDIIKSLRMCAASIKGNKGHCDKASCPVSNMNGRKIYPYCCADMFEEAADKIEELDERVAIMIECKEGGDESFDYGKC